MYRNLYFHMCTKAVQASKVSDGPSSLNMCKIPKALQKTCFPSTGNTEVFVSLHKNVYHTLNYNCVTSIKNYFLSVVGWGSF